MARPQHWARVRPGIECTLRRGAWYPVVELTPTEAVLAVNRQALRIPRASVQILPLPPPALSRRVDQAALRPVPRPVRGRMVRLAVASARGAARPDSGLWHPGAGSHGRAPHASDGVRSCVSAPAGWRWWESLDLPAV